MKKIKIDANVMKLIIISSIIFILIGKLVLNLVLTETGEKTSYSKDEVFEILQNAEEIRICKNYRTIFKKDYSIILKSPPLNLLCKFEVGDSVVLYKHLYAIRYL